MINIVYLPGVWDLIHPGHINVIKRAKLLGDYLIVGVCSDRLVRLHKGSHPALTENERRTVIDAIKWVDETYIYDNPDQTESIRLLNPSTFVVGEEFGHQGVPEHDLALEYCRRINIPIKMIPRLPSISSTEVKQKVHNSNMTKVISEFWSQRSREAKEGKIGILQSTSLTKTEEDAVERKEKDIAAILAMLDLVQHPKRKILELGCGTGRITAELANLYDEIYAVDYAQDFIDIAMDELKDHKNIFFQCAEITNPSIYQVEYDCCLIAGVLCYLIDSQIEEFLAMIPRTVHSIVAKESVGTNGSYELPDDHFSKEMGATYTAKYRSQTELAEIFGRYGFTLKCSEVVHQHREETHIRAFLFER